MRETRIKVMAAMETGNPSAAWEAILKLSEFCDLSASKLLNQVKDAYGVDLSEQDFGY